MAADPDRSDVPDSALAALVPRELLQVTLLIAVTVLAFVLTRAVAAGNTRVRAEDAAAWYDRGERALAGGGTAEAIVSLRRAANKDPGNPRFLLGLARALAADHQNDAARDILVGVRDASPEDATVNVELARLEVRRDDLPQAIRYYHYALNAVWKADQRDARRTLRTELVQLLLAHDQRSRALAELLQLVADLPDDAGAQTSAGQLFLDAGDPRRALDRFNRALSLKPHDVAAVSGAERAALELGSDTSAPPRQSQR
jgi:tetratricopeptide (TPR) repeat protein